MGRVVARYSPLGSSPILKSIRRIVANDLEEDREKGKNARDNVRFVLNLLFPNRGGDGFFDRNFRDGFLNLYDKIGGRATGEDVLGLYDFVARTYNTRNKTIKAPTVSFVRFITKKGYRKLGEFIPKTGALNMSIDFASQNELRSSSSHEFGHWFVLWGVGYDVENENSLWLIKRQTPKGKRPLDLAKKKNPFVVSNKENPTLCIRDDVYSQRLYPNQRVPGQKGENYCANELVSTGMEYLAIDPETFARRCPEQFDLLLDTFKVFASRP